LEKIRLAVLCDGALSKLLAMVAVAIMFVSRGRATVHEILLSLSSARPQLLRLRCFAWGR
jgi:hypothetical protein